MSKQILKKEKKRAFKRDIYLLGMDKEGVKYWLEAPSWDCNWYWGFGYVETYTNNRNPEMSKDISSHQHIDGSFMGKQGEEYIHNIFNAPLLTKTTFTEAEGRKLSELFNQFYKLKKQAETDKKDVKINKKLIPKVTGAIIEILSPK